MTFQSASQPQNLQQALAAFPSGIHFVSGIDTDAGKTVCTGWLARELVRAGRRVITMKLVQTGCDSVSPDLELHRRMTGVRFPEDEEGLTAPALFHHPASPHLAAELDGRTVEPEMLADCARRLAERYDIVLAEGAGGLAVPLTRELLAVDFAACEGWSFVFVTSGRLGSINHTLLGLEAIANRKAKLSALIYNDWCPGADPIIDRDTRAYLERACSKAFPEALWLECPEIDLAGLPQAA